MDNDETITEFDTLYPYPEESVRKSVNDDAKKHYSTRIVLNGIPIGYGSFFHARSDYNNPNLMVNGVKIGAQFKLWKKK